MSKITNFDDNLFPILKECKTLPVFFDVVFGFLKRRTDFYCIADSKDSTVGLPPGVAESIVKHTFFKWQTDNTINETINIDEPKIQNEITKTIPKAEKMEKGFTNAESYNGAVHEKYSWSQTIGDIDIIVKIPENVTTKQLSVAIQSQNISVKLKSTGEPFLNGELCRKVKYNEAIWSIDKSKMEIHLEKCAEVWWNCLMTDEDRLDISKIDCSRPFEDLSDEAKSKIEELTWNQERKRLGLPTTEQIDLENKLKKAWNVDGSPFSGPFDPKSVVMH